MTVTIPSTKAIFLCVIHPAGVQNVLGKRLGSRSTLNNARVTLKALGQLRTLSDYAEARGVPLDYMLS